MEKKENVDDNGSDMDMNENEENNFSLKENKLEVTMEKGNYNVHILIEEVKNLIEI